MSTRRKREQRHALSVKARYGLLQSALAKLGASLKQLGFANYADYLASPIWRVVRTRVFRRANGLCEACREAKPENVHHWSYDVETLLGMRMANLEAVCKPCHDQFHEVPHIAPKQAGKRAARNAYRKLVRMGGAIAQPRDMTPRLVR